MKNAIQQLLLQVGSVNDGDRDKALLEEFQDVVSVGEEVLAGLHWTHSLVYLDDMCSVGLLKIISVHYRRSSPDCWLESQTI